MILGDITRRNAALFGSRVGLVFEGQRITHLEFAKRIHRVANGLLAMGIRQQDRIAVLSRSSSQLLEICGTTDVVGFISLVLNHRLVLRELQDICLDAEPTVIFFAREFAETAAALRANTPSLCHSICIDGATEGAQSYEAMLAEVSDAEPAIRASAEDVAWLVYTSGTTGRPKGVMLTHAALLRAATANALEGSSPDPTTGLIVMPLFHVGGRLLFLVYTLLGGTVVLHANFDAEAILAAIASGARHVDARGAGDAATHSRDSRSQRLRYLLACERPLCLRSDAGSAASPLHRGVRPDLRADLRHDGMPGGHHAESA